ncbi:MAG: hypothetical protein WCK02_00270 [Bacteroidota bacterium]
MQIIIALINRQNINNKSDFKVRQEVISSRCAMVRDYFKKKQIANVTVLEAYSFEEINELVKPNNEKTIIFSNFPPNSTYGNKHFFDKEGKQYIWADSYVKTAENYQFIMGLKPNIDLNIITGAREYVLTDEKLREYFSGKNITIKRILFSSYESEIKSYIKDILDSDFS